MTALTMRAYQGADDYWAMRDFLRQAMLAYGRLEKSWHVARLDYWWWFINPELEKVQLEEQVFLWETEAKQMVAALNPEGRGEAYLQIHPDYLNAGLQEEMVSVAEERLTVNTEDGRRELRIFADSEDQKLHEILTQHGFRRIERSEAHDFQHRRALRDALPDVAVAAGYTVRALGDGLELLERVYASGLGFHEDDIHIARDNRDHPDWYRNLQLAPLYRRDLDIVAVAADGAVAAFCTIWFDDVTRTAYFEPVATVPAHRRKGLGKAVMLEGLHRLKKMGCEMAFVSGYSEAARSLYFSVMGQDHDVLEAWERPVQS